MKSTIRIVTLATILITARAYGQYYPVGDPFGSTVSAQSLGMGGVSTAFPSDNAAATMANPAQLGMFSLGGGLNAATDLTGSLNFSAVNAGTSLNDLWPQLPLKASIGIGYSNVSYSNSIYFVSTLPRLVIEQTGTFNGISAGVGFDYYIKLGFGYTFRWINSRFSDLEGTPFKHTAEDFGALVQIPIVSIVDHQKEKTVQESSGIDPHLDFNVGYAMRNWSGFVNSVRALPTEADLGWSLDGALRSEVDGHHWKWFSVSWSEQAGKSPVMTDSAIGAINALFGTADTTWNYYNRYEKGLGRFGIWQNLIVGRASATVGVARGGQIGLGEFLYLRAGDITYPGNLTATTFGWGLRLDGLIKCLVFLKSVSPQSPFAEFLLNHVDLQYDFGREYDTAYFGGETFESLNLVVR